MSSVRIDKGDYVTVTGQAGLTRVEVWRIRKTDDARAAADDQWNVYLYTESTDGFGDEIPIEFLEWDRWEYITSYRTKHDARASLPL